MDDHISPRANEKAPTVHAPPTRGTPELSDRRRALVLGSVAVAAGLAGAALAWRNAGGGGFGGAGDADSASVGNAAVSQLWLTAFTTPQGAPLDLTPLQGRRLLVNFWATWCPPCVAELPLLDRLHASQGEAGWQVLGLAVDQPASVTRFLNRAPVSFPIGMAGLGGIELSKSLGNTEGGLPFSVLIAANGQIANRKIGQIHPDELPALLGER